MTRPPVQVEVVALGLHDGALHWETDVVPLPDGADADLTARRLTDLAPDAGAVLHSTSWRQEGGGVVLTYAAFPVPVSAQARPVGAHLVTGPDAVTPAPPQVGPEHVAAHAVRHLADLSTDRDPHVVACSRRHPLAWALLRRHAARVHVHAAVPVPVGAPGPGVRTVVVEGPPGGLSALVDACTAVDGHSPFEEHTLLTLDGARQLPHARVEARDGAGLTGCAVLSEGVDGWAVELAVRPDARGGGVGRALLAQVLDHVRSHGGGTLRTWVHGDAAAARALAAAVRARVERRLLVLRRGLHELPEVAVPPGVRLRPLRLADDAERDAWLAVSNAAFAAHPENGGWSRADLDWRLATAWTDAARFPVAEDDEGLVAGVWTKVLPGSATGELHVVAVHPRAHGRGLGRTVVARALRDLRATGCTRAELYVDAGNAPALRLYAWAGFVPGTEHHCLAVDV